MTGAHTTTLEIPAWANGPDDSGNGGWSAGLLAGHVPVAAGRGVEVSLRVPPPIGRALRVAAGEGDAQRLLLDDDAGGAGGEPVVVATAGPVDVVVAVPPAVRAIDPARAAAASAGFPFRDLHPFPRCVSCGTRRAPGEVALNLHCGPVDGVHATDEAGESVPVFADAWVPAADVTDPTDPAHASVAACWSALDCPSAAPFADPHTDTPSVLARFAVRLHRPARIDEPHVLAAWSVAVDGRKQQSVSALLDARGDVLGVARALWIQVRPR